MKMILQALLAGLFIATSASAQDSLSRIGIMNGNGTARQAATPAPSPKWTGQPVGRAIGAVPGDQAETLPGAKLYALLMEAPTAPIAVVTGKVQATEFLSYHFRWFYDRDKRVLVKLEKTVSQGLDDHWSWIIFYHVAPADFRERLPFMRTDLRSQRSPFREAKDAFPLRYPQYPAVVVWP